MSSIQLSENNFTRRLAMLASLHLPDSLVEETIKRFIKTNGFPESKRVVPPIVSSPTRRGAVMPTGIKKAVRKVVSTLESEFSYRDVERLLRQANYRLAAKSPASSIGRVLRDLTKEGTLTEVKKGTGSDPSLFKKMQAAFKPSTH